MLNQKAIALGLAGVMLAATVAGCAGAQSGSKASTSRDWSRPETAVTESSPAPAPTAVAAKKKARPTTKAKPVVAVDGNRITINGQPAFLTGVVYPGRSNQDFGDGGWGHSGASDATTTAEVDADFANMAAQGVRVVKWNVFDDGRYSPEFDETGAVTGFDEKFLADLDAAVDLAEQHDLYLVLSLFSERFWTAKDAENGVALGGHAATLTDPALRASFVEKAIVPMLKHLAYTNRVLAYEIVDLPEFGIKDLTTDSDGRIRIPLADVQAFVKNAAAAVHANTVALATVHSNRASNMKQWKGLGLDYYSFNWQDWVEPYEPLGTDAAKYELDRPAMATVPAAGSKKLGLAQALEAVQGHGYAGVFAASYLMPTGDASWAHGAQAFTAFARKHWTGMALGKQEAPTGEKAALKPLPFSLKDLKFSATDKLLGADLKVGIEQTGSYAIQLLFFENGEKEPVALNDRVGLFQQGDEQDLKLKVFVDDLKPNTPYKVSVGFFSVDNKDWKLTKWFDHVALVTVKDSKVQALTGSAMEEAFKALKTQPGQGKGLDQGPQMPTQSPQAAVQGAQQPAEPKQQ